MIEAFGAIDVAGVSGRGRGAPVKRLPDLADDKKIIDLPGPQGPEDPVPPGRAIAASGPDRRHGIAPMRVLGMSWDGINQMHGILDANANPSRNAARASRPPFPSLARSASGEGWGPGGTPALLQRTVPPLTNGPP